MPELTRSQLRLQLRQLRRLLSPAQQVRAAAQLDRRLAGTGLLSRHRHIAFYLANDGEISPQQFLQRALRLGKRCYLPVLAPGNRLWFVRYRPGQRMVRNRFGIPEPARRTIRRPAWSLGLVLMPLVGFDRNGARLGMGGGFYDRSFSNATLLPRMKKPALVGLAHRCQELEQLAVESWDIPLSLIVTDEAVIKPKLIQ